MTKPGDRTTGSPKMCAIDFGDLSLFNVDEGDGFDGACFNGFSVMGASIIVVPALFLVLKMKSRTAVSFLCGCHSLFKHNLAKRGNIIVNALRLARISL